MPLSALELRRKYSLLLFFYRYLPFFHLLCYIIGEGLCVFCQTKQNGKINFYLENRKLLLTILMSADIMYEHKGAERPIPVLTVQVLICRSIIKSVSCGLMRGFCVFAFFVAKL